MPVSEVMTAQQEAFNEKGDDRQHSDALEGMGGGDARPAKGASEKCLDAIKQAGRAARETVKAEVASFSVRKRSKPPADGGLCCVADASGGSLSEI